MNWFWKVRIYDRDGHYWHGQIETGRDLAEIDAIQDFYKSLTGCKMLIEGMRDSRDPDVCSIGESFTGLWLKAANNR